MLKIENLKVNVEQKTVLNGLNLEIKPGEIHAIMGPNGSGKSTLAKAIAGHPSYDVAQGKIDFQVNGKYQDITQMEPSDRSREGIFLGFQYPIEVPGVSNFTFLKTAYDAICAHQDLEKMNDQDFLNLVRSKLEILEMSEAFLERSLNEGFSGGEKKKNEILQLLLLNPRLALLDETDSGLDIDALRVVSQGVNSFKSKYNSVVLVTHYQRLLDYIIPDFVHVLYQGRIIKSGTKELAKELEVKGYDWLTKE